MSGKRKTDKDEGTTAVLNGTEHTNGDQPYPQKIVKEFACPCGKDDQMVVRVVETEHQTKEGNLKILSAVCMRTYVKPTGEMGVSYSYRVHHIPVLTHLLNLAHAFILSTRVAEGAP